MYDFKRYRTVNKSENEPLTSYFLRVCNDLVISPRSLREELGFLYESTRTQQRSLDWPYGGELVDLTEAFGLTQRELKEMTLMRYRGLFPGYPDGYFGKFKSFSRPLVFWFTHPHTRICPLCLSEQIKFEISWKVRTLTICLRHKVFLRDTCKCGNKFSLESFTYNCNLILDLSILVKCPKCGLDLRSLECNPAPQEWIENEKLVIGKINNWSCDFDRKGLLNTPSKDFLLNFYHVNRVVVHTLKNIREYIGSAGHDFQDPSNYEQSSSFLILSKPEHIGLAVDMTLKTLRNWPDEFERQLRFLKQRGSNITKDYGRYTTSEIREVYDRLIKLSVPILNYHRQEIISESRLLKVRKLNDIEWLQVLTFLMKITGFTRLTLNLDGFGDKSTKRIMFKNSLRRAVEGLYYRLQTGKSFNKLPEDICFDWEANQLIVTLRKLNGLDALFGLLKGFLMADDAITYNALLNDPRDANLGITDYAWLRLRKLVPFGAIRGVKLKGSERVFPRVLAENVIRRLVLRLETKKACTKDSTQMSYWRNQLPESFQEFILAVLDMAQQQVDFSPNINGMIISDQTWHETKVEDGLIDLIRYVPKAGSVRKTLEVIMRSLFFKEILVSEAIHKEIKPGYHRCTARIWGQIWASSQQFKLLMDRLAGCSKRISKLLITEVSTDIVTLCVSLEAKRANTNQ